ALEKWLQNNPHALPNNVVEIETTRVAP
ncbi:glutaredoxin, partial [Vibrio cholerae]|nr:glutaredoxin [Vibrio cholerae]